ncbi:hypothetical protein Trydic_g6099 [Trypoxylus dichotomus]
MHNKEMVRKLNKREVASERLLTIAIGKDDGRLWTIIVVYGPREDDKVDEKESFWEQVTKITEESRGTL